MNLNWHITDQNVIVNYDGQTHIVSRKEPLSDKLIEALKAKDYENIPSLVSKAKFIEKQSDGKFVVKDGCILIDGVSAPLVLSKKIMQFADEGLPHEPLVLFAKKLLKNPSYRSVQQLYTFLEKNDHPITSEGNFIAYKKVRADFKDVHTGTFDNSVGKVVEMPRNQVNEDPQQTCSNGLHAANWSYASQFYAGGVMLEVEIDPADVVAIPIDYDSAKMRVCRYKVLSVVNQELSTSLRVTTPEPTSRDLGDLYEEDEDEDDEDWDEEDWEDYEDEDECDLKDCSICNDSTDSVDVDF